MESIIHLILITLPILTGPVAAFVSMSLIARDQYKALTTLWIALGVIAIPYGIYIAYSFVDFFPGPGCAISLFLPITAAISIWVIRSRSKGGVTEVPLRKRLAFAALAVIPITQCGAPVIGSGYARPCALPSTPSPYPSSNLERDWSLYYCGNSNKHTLLLVPIIGSDTQQTYDFNTARWSMANALDGYCR